MSESVVGISEDDGWVFDSLVNFLHGAIWKLPVLGFIEEKSVVFDPDSYNNMTDDKEGEFRKIHDEYKALVDYMLTSFMEDLQVTPEQVEQSCRLRELNNKAQPESHITKVALDQLWAAEDFGAFRRLMTRKNIDLQLQSLELLVAKYGVLSPSLRPPNTTDDDNDPNGEEDFLQVVIRYTDIEPENTIFHSSLVTSSKCCPSPPLSVPHVHSTIARAVVKTTLRPADYDISLSKGRRSTLPNADATDAGAESNTKPDKSATPKSPFGFEIQHQQSQSQPGDHQDKDKDKEISKPRLISTASSNSLTNSSPSTPVKRRNQNKPMLQGVPIAPLPQILLMSNTNSDTNKTTEELEQPQKERRLSQKQKIELEKQLNSTPVKQRSRRLSVAAVEALQKEIETWDVVRPATVPDRDRDRERLLQGLADEPDPKSKRDILTARIINPKKSETNESSDPNNDCEYPVVLAPLSEPTSSKPSTSFCTDTLTSSSRSRPGSKNGESFFPPESVLHRVGDSQILQQDEHQLQPGQLPTTPIDDIGKTFLVTQDSSAGTGTGAVGDGDGGDGDGNGNGNGLPRIVAEVSQSQDIDEETASEMVSAAPEQHRILTAVRRALDVPSGEEGEPIVLEHTTSELPTVGTEEEIERRREYLRSQRDKLVALKKREREKQLVNYDRKGGGGGGGGGFGGGAGSSSRPKSAKAAHIALKSPDSITGINNDKSLQARRALAQRLKQELVEQQ